MASERDSLLPKGSKNARFKNKQNRYSSTASPSFDNDQSSEDLDADYNGEQKPAVDAVRAQMGDLMSVLHQNISKVVDRGDRIEDLQDKTETLAASSVMFQRQSRQTRRNMQLRNMRLKLIVGVTGLTIIIGLIGTV